MLILFKSLRMKYRRLALDAAGRYHSRALSISTEVTRASATFISISAAVFFVVSKLITSAASLSTFGPADDNLEMKMQKVLSGGPRIQGKKHYLRNKSSSNDFNVILNVFCCLVSSAFVLSRSGRSALTTSPKS